MRNCTSLFIVFILCLLWASTSFSQESGDRYMWLEEIESDKVLEWVKTKNKSTVDELEKYPEYQDINTKVLSILNSKDKIAYPSIRGDYIYNFWQDATHQRGIWRRVPFKGYFKDAIEWETVLDLDELSEKEGEKWAFEDASFLYKTNDLCLLSLSRGGADAVVTREFDLKKKSFVEDGFYIPEAKSDVSWIDRSTLVVSTDFGKGTTTTSGYPRITKIWKRGTALAEAHVLFEGEESDVGAWGFSINTPENQYLVVMRALTFFSSQKYILHDDKLVQLDIPEDSQLHGIFKKQLLVELKSDWKIEGNTYKEGALVSIDYGELLKGKHNIKVIFVPNERSSLASVSMTQNYLLINKLENVISQLYRYSLENGDWVSSKIDAPNYGTISIISTEDFSDHYFFQFTNFLNPSMLYYVYDKDQRITLVKSLPHYFKSENLQVEQYEVASKDGTKIPYFIIFSKDIVLDGSNPTLLYGYGGFEVAMRPYYSATLGVSWLEKGGVYVHANIRGGGEFGPNWHKAAIKENKQKSYDDFIAIAEDLIQRKITSPDHLGIMGGSNGGLLVGVACTQRPDLFNAVVCSAPLLDMKRYNKLLAGASWMDEYGDPDIPEQWEYIKKYSPYHNIHKSKEYPKILFTVTTRDDRVHPAHARKMAAKMEEQGHKFYYFENIEGGHGAGVTNEQRSQMISIEYTYLLKMLNN